MTDPTSIYYSPTTKFLLITPPPVDAVVRNLELATRDYPRVPDRDSERTRLFAVAVQEVAAEAGVPCQSRPSDLESSSSRFYAMQVSIPGLQSLMLQKGTSNVSLPMDYTSTPRDTGSSQSVSTTGHTDSMYAD